MLTQLQAVGGCYRQLRCASCSQHAARQCDIDYQRMSSRHQLSVPHAYLPFQWLSILVVRWLPCGCVKLAVPVGTSTSKAFITAHMHNCLSLQEQSVAMVLCQLHPAASTVCEQACCDKHSQQQTSTAAHGLRKATASLVAMFVTAL